MELFVVGLGSSDHVTSVAQSACFRDIEDVRAIKLFFEFKFLPPPVDKIFAYRSENLPLKYEQLILLSFGQHPRLAAVEQDRADKGIVNGKFCLM
jgi:hypothetical protein